VSAELARGRRIRLFFLLLGIILFMGAGEALAFVVGGRLLPLGFALWLAFRIGAHALRAGAVAAAFEEALAGSAHEAEVRAELERVLTLPWAQRRPTAVAFPGLAGLALLLALAPKSVLNLSEFEPVVLVPPPPPPAGARFLLGTPEEMYDVAILPDGERVALLTYYALEIRRWGDLQVLWSFPAHGFSRLAVSPRGDLVAGGGIVVDPDLGRIVRTYPRAWKEALAFDRTGTQLLVARRAQGAVRVTAYDPRAEVTYWEAEFPLEQEHRNAEPVHVELSPDGAHVLLVLCNSIEPLTFTYVFELSSHRTVRKLEGYGVFVSEKQLLVFPILEGDLERIGLEDGARHRLLTFRALPSRWILVRPGQCPPPRAVLDREGRRAAAVVIHREAEHREVQVWDFPEGRQVWTFSLVRQEGRTLRVRLWPFAPVSLLFEIDVERPSQRFCDEVTLYLSPTGERLALLNYEWLVLADLESQTVRAWEGFGHTLPIWVWLPNGTGLVSQRMIVWDLRTGTTRRPLRREFEFHNPVAQATPKLLMSHRSFVRNVNEAITELALWCPRTWRLKATFELPGNLLLAALGPDEDVASLGLLGYASEPFRLPHAFSLVELSLTSGRVNPLLHLKWDEQCLALSPSGRYAALYRGYHFLEVVELRSQRTVARWEMAEPKKVQFSSDERRLALAHDAEVEIRSLSTAQQIWSAPERLKGLAFHPKADVLAGVTEKGELVLWDFQSGQELARFPPIPRLCEGYHRAGSCLSFSPDGAWLASTDGQFIIVWPSPVK
ncbi:MAG: WD40 repeat domain-containing protein, partial [Candidatus Bipolaricaulaceae bacterium]